MRDAGFPSNIAGWLNPFMRDITLACGKPPSRSAERMGPLLTPMEPLKPYPKMNPTYPLDQLIIGTLNPLFQPITDSVKNDKDSNNGTADIPNCSQPSLSSIDAGSSLQTASSGTRPPSGGSSTEQKDPPPPKYLEVVKKFVWELKDMDVEAIKCIIKDDIKKEFFKDIGEDISSLKFKDVDKEKLKKIVKALEHIFVDGIFNYGMEDSNDPTYKTIRNYSKTQRAEFEKELMSLISTPTEENVTTAKDKLKTAIENQEWWIELTFLMEYREKINTLIEESGFRNIESIDIPPKLQQYLSYDEIASSRAASGPLLNYGRVPFEYILTSELDYTNATFEPLDINQGQVTFDPKKNTITVLKQEEDKSAVRGGAKPVVTQTEKAFTLTYTDRTVKDFELNDDTATFTLIDKDQNKETVTLRLGYMKENDGLSKTKMGIELLNDACDGPIFIKDTDDEYTIGEKLRARKPVIYFYNFNSNRVISTSVVVDKKLIIDELIPKFNHVININEASSMVLASLPCIGHRLAERIVAYRPNGGYSSVTDLLQIEGIGKKTFATIKPFISIDNNPNHWIVKQSPKHDGSVIDIKDNDTEYPYLFWEANAPLNTFKFNIDQSFCVKKDVLTSFLTEKLAVLGLNKKESVDFIEFWVPLLTGDSFKMYPYVMVEFMEKNYTDLAQLHIHPKPEQVIRVFAYFKFSEKPVICGEPELLPVKRIKSGSLVVEWGGTESIPDSLPMIETSVTSDYQAIEVS